MITKSNQIIELTHKCMPSLCEKPTLHDFQQYVRQLEVERGFTDETVLQKCLMLGEEVGELFKAIRKSEGIKVDKSSEVGQIDHELADVLIFLLTIANRCGVDLEQAFRGKEEINMQRVWQKPV